MNTKDLLVILILIILLIPAFLTTLKHFRGEGGCCGGAPKPKKKKLRGKVVKTYIWQIEGMHCQNCANNVTRAINDIDGASAKVNLNKKEVRIQCDRDIDQELIVQAIERRGYAVKK